MNAKLENAATLHVDELAAATSKAVLQSISDHLNQHPTLVVNPRIWIGLWVDLQHSLPGKLGDLPGQGPAVGGP